MPKASLKGSTKAMGLRPPHRPPSPPHHRSRVTTGRGANLPRGNHRRIRRPQRSPACRAFAAPKGALLHGRITRAERHLLPSYYFLRFPSARNRRRRNPALARTRRAVDPAVEAAPSPDRAWSLRAKPFADLHPVAASRSIPLASSNLWLQ